MQTKQMQGIQPIKVKLPKSSNIGDIIRGTYMDLYDARMVARPKDTER